MNKHIVAALGLLASMALAHADTKHPEQLAKEAGCLSCHSIKDKVVGPSYKAVAEKYKDQKDAAAHLVQSVRNGSKGNWGRIPMPAHPSMSEAEIKTLVAWVLSQK